MASTFSATTSIGLLILRAAAGGLMLTHGWGKLQMALKGEHAGFPDPLGIGERMSLYGAVTGEFFAPALIVLGLGTRIAAIPAAFTMVIAAFVIHKGDPLDIREKALFYLAAFLAIMFTGPGAFSLDALFFGRRKAKVVAVKPAA